MRKLILESCLEKQVCCSQTMHTTIGNNKIGLFWLRVSQLLRRMKNERLMGAGGGGRVWREEERPLERG